MNDLVGAAGEESLYQSGATEAEGAEALKTLVRERHRVVGKVVDDFDRNNFNTCLLYTSTGMLHDSRLLPSHGKWLYLVSAWAEGIPLSRVIAQRTRERRRCV